MADVRGDVLRPPHGTTPATVKANLIMQNRTQSFLFIAGLAWENLQDILKLEEDNGLHLYHTVRNVSF